MKFKKYSAILAAIIMSISFVSCGEKDESGKISVPDEVKDLVSRVIEDLDESETDNEIDYTSCSFDRNCFTPEEVTDCKNLFTDVVHQTIEDPIPLIDMPKTDIKLDADKCIYDYNEPQRCRTPDFFISETVFCYIDNNLCIKPLCQSNTFGGYISFIPTFHFYDENGKEIASYTDGIETSEGFYVMPDAPNGIVSYSIDFNRKDKHEPDDFELSEMKNVLHYLTFWCEWGYVNEDNYDTKNDTEVILRDVNNFNSNNCSSLCFDLVSLKVNDDGSLSDMEFITLSKTSDELYHIYNLPEDRVFYYRN